MQPLYQLLQHTRDTVIRISHQLLEVNASQWIPASKWSRHHILPACSLAHKRTAKDRSIPNICGTPSAPAAHDTPPLVNTDIGNHQPPTPRLIASNGPPPPRPTPHRKMMQPVPSLPRLQSSPTGAIMTDQHNHTDVWCLIPTSTRSAPSFTALQTVLPTPPTWALSIKLDTCFLLVLQQSESSFWERAPFVALGLPRPTHTALAIPTVLKPIPWFCPSVFLPRHTAMYTSSAFYLELQRDNHSTRAVIWWTADMYAYRPARRSRFLTAVVDLAHTGPVTSVDASACPVSHEYTEHESQAVFSLMTSSSSSSSNASMEQQHVTQTAIEFDSAAAMGRLLYLQVERSASWWWWIVLVLVLLASWASLWVARADAEKEAIQTSKDNHVSLVPMLFLCYTALSNIRVDQFYRGNLGRDIGFMIG